MAQQALGAGGTTVTRKRALFGLLDANGWSWAAIKALFWFTVIIFMMGYMPDRALYFTIFPTIDLGLSVVSPVNICPTSNGEGMPCPVPAGAVLPWEVGPGELTLPQPRTDGVVVQSGTNLLYIGGSTNGTDAVATVYASPIRSAEGNLSPWTEMAPLPEPRRAASAVVVGGTVYVIGGFDASGAPTSTVFAGTPDTATGVISTWAPSDVLALPEARGAAAAAVAGDGIILVGGTGPSGPTATAWKSTLDTKGAPAAWKPMADMPEKRTAAFASLQGAHLYVYGGSAETGPTTIVLRGDVSAAKETVGQILSWGISRAGSTLPLPREGASAWSNAGTLYFAAGTGPDAQGQVWWAIPDANGDISAWQNLPASDLPSDLQLRGSQAAVSGPYVFLVGGTTANGVTGGVARSSLAPKPPYFQLGIVGATVPGLGIGGEVGQQLSYLVAAGVATVNFVILILIGLAFAHPDRTKRLFSRVRRRGRPAA
jgi:N-acetylneuraminic acid mutarotase